MNPLQSVYTELGLEKEGFTFDEFAKEFDKNPELRKSSFSQLGLEKQGFTLGEFESNFVKKKDSPSPDSKSGEVAFGDGSLTTPPTSGSEISQGEPTSIPQPLKAGQFEWSKEAWDGYISKLPTQQQEAITEVATNIKKYKPTTTESDLFKLANAVSENPDRYRGVFEKLRESSPVPENQKDQPQMGQSGLSLQVTEKGKTRGQEEEDNLKPAVESALRTLAGDDVDYGVKYWPEKAKDLAKSFNMSDEEFQLEFEKDTRKILSPEDREYYDDLLYVKKNKGDKDPAVQESVKSRENKIATDKANRNHVLDMKIDAYKQKWDGKDFDPETKEEHDRIIRSLEREKKGFFEMPIEQRAEVYEIEKGKTRAAGETAVQRLDNLYKNKYTEAATLAVELGFSDRTPTLSRMLSTVSSQLASMTFGRTEASDRYFKLLTELRELAPIVSLNRNPKTQEGDNFFERAGKTFLGSFAGNDNLAQLLYPKEETRSSTLLQALFESGEASNEKLDGLVKDLEKSSESPEFFTWKDWGDMLGTTGGFMLKFASGTGAASKLPGIAKLRTLAKNGKGFTKFLAKTADYAISSEATGTLFNERDEVNWKTGIVGGAMGSLFEGGVELLLPKIKTVFGSSWEKAMTVISKVAGVQGKALGEVAEEVGEELGSIWDETTTGKDFWAVYNERFGKPNSELHFFVQTYMMGLAFGVGEAFSQRTKKSYDSLSESDKKTADSFVKEMAQSGIEIAKISKEDASKPDDPDAPDGEAGGSGAMAIEGTPDVKPTVKEGEVAIDTDVASMADGLKTLDDADWADFDNFIEKEGSIEWSEGSQGKSLIDKVAMTYKEAKENGTQPEFVKVAEDLIKKVEEKSITKQSEQETETDTEGELPSVSAEEVATTTESVEQEKEQVIPTEGSEKPVVTTQDIDALLEKGEIDADEHSYLKDLVESGEITEEEVGAIVGAKEAVAETETTDVKIDEVVPESIKEGFTEGKDLNKIYADVKGKHGEKKGVQLYDVATRLVNPNNNTIVEIRGNGVVVKEGGKYILKPFGNTDANVKKWTLYKGIDVTEQFQQPKAETASKTKAPVTEKVAPKDVSVGDVVMWNGNPHKVTAKNKDGSFDLSNTEKKGAFVKGATVSDSEFGGKQVGEKQVEASGVGGDVDLGNNTIIVNMSLPLDSGVNTGLVKNSKGAVYHDKNTSKLEKLGYSKEQIDKLSQAELAEILAKNIENPNVETSAKMPLAEKQTTTQEFLNEANKEGGRFAELAKALKQFFGIDGVETEIVKGLKDFFGKKNDGDYANNKIRIDEKAKNKLQTFLHEAIHKVTVDKLLQFERGDYSKLSKQDIEAIQNLIRIFNESKVKIHEFLGGGKGNRTKGHYGFTNVHEFISEAFTNPEFQSLLKNLPTEGNNPTIFKQFLDAVAKFLGLKDASILNDIFYYTENLNKKAVEQSLKETTIAGSGGVVDVEATAKALESLNETDHKAVEDINDKLYQPKYVEENKAREVIESFTHYKSGSNKYPATKWARWFQSVDANAKKDIVDDIKNNPELRNSMLSLLYDLCKKEIGFKGSFDEFILEPIKLYRGVTDADKKGKGQEGFSAYSISKNRVSGYAHNRSSENPEVREVIVRPIDTYGAVNYIMGAEVEVLLPQSLSKETLQKEFNRLVELNIGEFSENQKSKLEQFYTNDDYIGGVQYAKSVINGTHKTIAEAYHKAKADGTNPELVKAVEQSLKETTKAGSGVGGDVIKDDKGVPVSEGNWYHGSPTEGISGKDLKPNEKGLIFFTRDKGIAERYATNDYEGNTTSANVFERKLEINNIFDPEKNSDNAEIIDLLATKGNFESAGRNADFDALAKEALENGEWSVLETKDFIDGLKKLGYDAIYIDNRPYYSENAEGKRTFSRDIAVFDTKQHKAVEQSLKEPKAETPQTQAERIAEKKKQLKAEVAELNKLATKIRGAKINTKGKAFDASIGLPIAVWNGAIEIVAKAIEAGVSTADAIKRGLNYINKTHRGQWNKKAFNEKVVAELGVRGITVNGEDLFIKDTKEFAEVVNGFYSDIEQSLLDSKKTSATGKEWTEILGNADEAKWTGLTDWLSQQQGSVSKADIQQFLKDNRIQVVEVVKDDRKGLSRAETIEYNKIDKEIDGLEKERTRIARESYDKNVTPERQPEYQEVTAKIKALMVDWERLRDKAQDKSKDSKFKQYQLEGEKENYKEVLITMPSRTPNYTPITELPSGYDITFDSRNNTYAVIEENQTSGKSITGRYHNTKEDAVKNAIEVINAQRKNVVTGKAFDNQFKSSHFDEPNILVHLRMNTRTDVQGNKVLFLEEVQSDWGQKGKKEGFKEPSFEWDTQLGKDAVVVLKKMNETAGFSDWKGLATAMAKSNDILNDFQVPYDNKDLMLKWHSAVNQERKVPTAPFVTDTNAWTKLGLKVALKEAVKQGADKIAWTTGTQQFDRWGSEKIDWVKTPIENYEIRKDSLSGEWVVTIDAMGVNGRNKAALRIGFPTEKEAKDYVSKGSWQIAINEQVAGTAFDGINIDEKALSERGIAIVSKEDLRVAFAKTLKRERNDAEIDKLTDRIWNRMQTEDSGTSLPRKEGMEGFYGVPSENKLGIVGNVAKSLFKQEPKTVEISTRENISSNDKIYEAYDRNGNLIKRGNSEAYIKSFAEQNNGTYKLVDAKQKPTQHSIDITPELKESTSKGIPLFGSNVLELKNRLKAEVAEFGKIMGGQANTGLNPKAIVQMAKIAKTVVELGALNFKDFAKAVRDNLKGYDISDNLLQTLWSRKTKFGEETEKVSPSEIAERIAKEQPAPKTKAEEIAEQKEKLKEGEKKEEATEKEAPAPKKKKTGKKQRGFQKQLNKVVGEIGDVFRDVVSKNILTYDKMNRNAEFSAAAEQIAEMGIDNAFNLVTTPNPKIEGVQNSDARVQVIRQILAATYADVLLKATKDGDKKTAEDMFNRINKLQEAISVLGTEMGQANAMLATRLIDPVAWAAFINMATAKENAKKKESLTKEETKEIDEVAEVVKNEAESIQKEAETVAEKVANSTKVKKATTAKKFIPSGKIVAEIKKRRKSYWDEIKNIMGQQGFATTPMKEAMKNVKVAGLLKKIAMSYVQEGFIKLSDWKRSMAIGLKKIGITATPTEMSELWEDSGAAEKARKLSDALDPAKAHELAKSVIGEHWRKPDGKTLKQRLIDAGFSDVVADKIAKATTEEFKKEWAEKKKEASKKPFIGATTKKVKSVASSMHEKMLNAIESGALDEDAFRELFLQKLGFSPSLTVAQISQFAPFLTQMRRNQPGSPLYNIAAQKFATLLNGFYPNQGKWAWFTGVVDKWTDLAYASMLSSPITSVKNIVSAGSNIFLERTGIKPILNLSLWGRAAIRGVKEKSLGSFYDQSPINAFLMTWANFGVKNGWMSFKDIFKSGTGATAKEMETAIKNGIAPQKGLEENGGKPFIQLPIKINGHSYDLNLFNLAKYVGRNLLAQDAFMFSSAYEMHLSNTILQKYIEDGLRGKALRTAVTEAMKRKNIDTVAVNNKAQEIISDYETSTGLKLNNTQKSLILMDAESNAMLEAVGIAEEQVEETKELARGTIFTDTRNGIGGQLASLIAGTTTGPTDGARGVKKAGQLIGKYVIKPFVPFTRIVGNVLDFMIDSMPVYGIARAHGISPTNILAYLSDSKREDGSLASAKLGKIGSQKYYEQVGRGFVGTAAWAITGVLLSGTDDDDDIQLTGSKGNQSTPKNTLRIYGLNINYTLMPMLGPALNAIGNYNDLLVDSGKDPEKITSSELMTNNFKSLLQAGVLVKDMSFVKSINEFVQDISSIQREFQKNEWTEEDAKDPKSNAGKYLSKFAEKIGRYYLAPLPQNWNVINQIEKAFSPEGRESETSSEMLATLAGAQYLNNKRVGIFGEDVKYYVGTDVIDYGNASKLSQNPGYKILGKYGVVPYDLKYKNNPIKVESKLKDLTDEEFQKLAIAAGKKFESYLMSADKGGIMLVKPKVSDKWSIISIKDKNQIDVPDLSGNIANNFKKSTVHTVSTLLELYNENAKAARKVIKELRGMAYKETAGNLFGRPVNRQVEAIERERLINTP